MSQTPLSSITTISMGLIYLMAGWKLFRLFTAILFFLLGLFLGLKLGNIFASPPITGGILSVIFLALSFPVLRFTVTSLCVVLLGAAATILWVSHGLPEKYIILCLITGMILGGLFGFYLFKAAIIATTASIGAYFTIAGIWSLLVLSSRDTAINVEELYNKVVATNYSIMFIIPFIIGFLIQMRSFPPFERKKDQVKED